MTQKLKTAIIGCGKVAHIHAKALINAKGSHFAAVCSRSPEKRLEFAEKYNVKAYSDTEEMICKEHIDIVVVCTPHPTHKESAVTALSAGAHVLVEKPMASSLQDCDAMLATAAMNNKKIGVVSQRRFYSPCQRLFNAVSTGKIGTPALGTVQMLGWRDKAYYESDPWRGKWIGEGGGVLVNQAPHQIDILQWFMGGEMDELYGIWRNMNHPYIEVDDTALAILKFKNGGLANIVVSNSQKPGIYGKVHIHGSNGASVGVQTDGGAMFVAGMSAILDPPVNDLWTIPGEENFLAKWVQEDSDFFNSINPVEYYIRLQDEDFIQSVMEDREPLVNGREGRKTVEIFSAIYRSCRDNIPVKWPLNAEGYL